MDNASPWVQTAGATTAIHTDVGGRSVQTPPGTGWLRDAIHNSDRHANCTSINFPQITRGNVCVKLSVKNNAKAT